METEAWHMMTLDVLWLGGTNAEVGHGELSLR